MPGSKAMPVFDSISMRRAMGAARMVFYSCETATGHTVRSENCVAVMGIPSAGPTEQWSELILPDDRPYFENAINSISPGKPGFEVEYRVLHGLTGTLFWVLDRGEGDYDEAGKLRHLHGAIVEISDKAKQQEQRSAEARLHALAFESARMGAWHLDVTANSLSYSDELLSLVGLDREQFDGTPEAIDQIVHSDDIGPWRAAREGSLAPGGKVEIEFRINLPRGGTRWFLSRGEVRRGENGIALECYGVMIDITERKNSEEVAARLAAIVTSSEDAIISSNFNGIITSWNLGAERLLGFSAKDMIGRPISTIIPMDMIHEASVTMNAARQGEAIAPHESVRLREDGSRVDVSLTVSPIRGGAGKVTGTSTIARDITDRKNWDKRQAVLLRELSHRVKNTLAVVQSISRQTLRASKDPEIFARAFEGRIRSLAASHSLLTDSEWRGAMVGDVVRSQLGGVVDDMAKRITLHGPNVLLPAEAATQLGLVLHELGTNAAKYGALSALGGTIFIGWKVTIGKLRMFWRERGGPPIAAPPAHTGFGSVLINSSVTAIHRRFATAGLTCRLELVF